MKELVYRVQAGDGRGPWRPRFSHLWADESRTKMQAGILEAFGTDFLKEIPRGWHSGCACRSFDALMEWFTPIERTRLEAMGFKPVGMYVDRVIRENKDQVVFARRLPLREAAAVVEWDGSWLTAVSAIRPASTGADR